MFLVKVKLWFLFIFLCTSLASKEIIYVLTIPKSGTHLLEKYFKLLKKCHKFPNVKIKRSHLSETHLALPKQYFFTCKEKKIILVRDIRDVLCSTRTYLTKTKHYLCSKVTFKNSWKRLSVEEQLYQIMDYMAVDTDAFAWKCHEQTLPQKIYKFVQKAIELSKTPNTLLVKFEDLVGPLGNRNCNTSRHRETIREINKFLGIHLCSKQEKFIMRSLFGNAVIKTATFNKGKVNTWKMVFSERLKKIFKELYGQELIALGYEMDFNW